MLRNRAAEAQGFPRGRCLQCGPMHKSMSSTTPRRARRRLLLGLLGAVSLSACQTPTVEPPVQPASAPPVHVPPPPPRPPRIGLALGGGAARGFAHIGVIQVLEEHGIKPQLVTGTSAGSLVAALYASGRSGAELGVMAQGMDESALTDWAFPGRGVIKGEALATYVRKQTGGLNIEQLKMPLGIVATDLADGQPILFQRGDVGMAVRASSSVPAVFQPVRIGNREYVDGGLVSPVPVRYARQMGAEMVIAVDISTPPDPNATGDSVRVLLQTFSIMGRSINYWELKGADIVVRPALVGVAGTDFTARMKAVQSGREAALAMLPAIQQKIQQLTR